MQQGATGTPQGLLLSRARFNHIGSESEAFSPGNGNLTVLSQLEPKLRADHNEKRRLPPRCHTCYSELVATTHKVWTSCFPPVLVAPGSLQDHAPDCKTQSHLFPFSPRNKSSTLHFFLGAKLQPTISTSLLLSSCCFLLEPRRNWPDPCESGTGAGQLARCRLQKFFPSPPPPGMVRNEAVAEEGLTRAVRFLCPHCHLFYAFNPAGCVWGCFSTSNVPTRCDLDCLSANLAHVPTNQQTGTDYVQIHTASTKFGQQMSIVLLCQNTKPKTSFAPQLQIASPAILLLDTRTTNQPKQVEVFQSLSMLL